MPHGSSRREVRVRIDIHITVDDDGSVAMRVSPPPRAPEALGQALQVIIDQVLADKNLIFLDLDLTPLIEPGASGAPGAT